MRGTRVPTLAAGWAASLTPRFLLLPLLRREAKGRRERILERDRREAQSAAGTPFDSSLDAPVFVIDGYRGGVTPWDWLALPGGGLWYAFLWPLVGETVLQRVKENPRLRAVLELDGHTFEEMTEKASAAVSRIREALATGRLELVNGAYAQPLSQTISGESNIRHLYYGLSAIEEALGVRVVSYLAGEPQFFPQLPQILAGFGFKGVVLRTHWAAFGGDPAEDAALVRWQGPDGTEIPAVPRYQFMDYDVVEAGSGGLAGGGLSGSDLDAWDNDRLERFRDEAVRRGIERPLLSRLADPTPPRAPFPGIAAVAARQDLRFVTPREYFDLAADGAPTVSYAPDDIPSAIPWGLGGGRLQRDGLEAEGNLLLAERLDALAYAMGRASESVNIDAAWKGLLRSQHHDLHICGPWLSRRHGRSISEVGQEMAIVARKSAGRVAQGAVEFLASLVDSSSAQGRAFLLFNPSSWPRREYIELTLKGDGFRIYRGEHEVPSQVVHRGGREMTLGFVVGLPALGYQLLDVRPLEPAPAPPETSASAPATAAAGSDLYSFANPFYSVQVDPQSCLRLDVDGRTLVEGGHLTVWRDGRYHDSRASAGRVELFQQGPVLERYRREGRLAGIPFCQWITLYRSLPRIDLRVEFNFGTGATFGPQSADNAPQAPHYVQDEKKLCLNLLSSLRRSFSDSPFLISDVAGERISGLSLVGLDDEQERGVALLNRGTPGHYLDRERGILRNVLAWAPKQWPYASDNSVTGGGSRYTALRGGYAYECALVPCPSRLKALQAAVDYQLPCLGVLLSPRPGQLPSEGSFLRVDPDGVLLSSLFVQKGKVYARIWNASPEGRQATIRSGGPLSLSACPLDLSAEAPTESIDLPPWGLQTLRLGGPAPR